MCCDISIQQRTEPRIALRCVVVVACLGLAACGGSGPEDGDVDDTAALTSASQNQNDDPRLTNPPADILTTSTSKAQAATWRALLNSPNYSGRIVVRFADDAALTLDPTVSDPHPFVSRTGKSVSRVNGIRQALPSVPVRRLFHDVSDDTLRAFRARKRAEGVTLHDWTQVYVFEVPDPVAAELVLMGLFADPHVVWAHPEPVLQIDRPPYYLENDGWKGGKIQSILTPEQGYLLNKPGSLYIVEESDKDEKSNKFGLTGAGQRVFDIEGNWNYTHEDLPLNTATTPGAGVPFSPEFANDQGAINHGTAMAGIIVAKKNGLGVTGVAPNATFRTIPMAPGAVTGAIGGLKGVMTDPLVEKLYGAIDTYTAELGGEVIMIPVAVSSSTGKYCWEMNADGTWKSNQCFPVEAYTANFELIQDLTNQGVVVVEGAGNNNLDLNIAKVKENCGAECKDLATNDSGAIVVGASMGEDLARHPLSNCGNRINVFAWGSGVVTTGYGDHDKSVIGDPNQAYTKKFDGTSAATAIISGVVLLLQEYVNQLYGDTLKPWEYVYLNAAQVRALLIHPEVGVSQSDAGCNIGKQPNVGKALELLKNGVIKPTIGIKGNDKCKNGGQGVIPECANPAILAKALDINADITSAGNSRADLIAWGRDGQWFIDLSAGDTEGYGKWDLILTPPPLDAGRLFPVVQDYNADGKVDLALYNTDTGIWRIKYTTDALFAEQFGDWDVVIDYQALQPQQWKAGSWPAPGDYDGKTDVIYQRPDGTYATGKSIDLALVRPDGRWLVDFNLGIEEPFGDFETDLKFLTTAQLDEAPGWAYLPVVVNLTGTDVPAFKLPDGILDGERFCKFHSDAIYASAVEEVEVYTYPPIFGSNANALVPQQGSSTISWVGLRNEQTWPIVSLVQEKVTNPPLMEGFGGVECRPITADFDGDKFADRAVLCPNGEWKIAYSSTKFVTKTTILKPVKNGAPFQAVPGTVYPGGVSYQEIKDIYSYYNFGCAKSTNCTMDNLTPPIGPYFAECRKLWANHPLSCLEY